MEYYSVGDSMALKVLIVDDHEVARQGLTALLSNHEITIAAAVSSTAEAIEQVKSRDFDVVLLDVRMHDSDGLSALEAIRALFPDLPVVMLSAYDNPTYVARAAALGASDYLLKSAKRETLQLAINKAVNGAPLGPCSRMLRIREVMTQEVDTSTLPPELPLTSREAQVLRHIALGLSNKEIAVSLNISVETVKEHVQNVLRKVDANDRTDAAVRAVKLGMVD
ncbi:MAG: response regulator transcription factor [Pirellulales bacterium]|nr:response regulator transcription factor [Pirellulales bacterium]